MTAVLELVDVTRLFHLRGAHRAEGRIVRAVDRVSLTVRHGEIIGIAGESGSGKTTVAEMVLGLQAPTRGRIFFEGEDVAGFDRRARQAFHRRAQMIFQDPYESINPQHLVRRWVEEPLIIHGIGTPAERAARVSRALEQAELRPAGIFLNRYPHQLSGGQRQRVAIARAIVLEPAFLVADEPVSMLDVSIRAGILRLLRRLRAELGLTIVYISHDLSTVRYVADRVAIMYRGKLVEIGAADDVLGRPLHPYTRALLSAVPTLALGGPRRPRVALTSTAPPPVVSCRFADRCPQAMPACRQREPALVEITPGHAAACFLHSEASTPETHEVSA